MQAIHGLTGTQALGRSSSATSESATLDGWVTMQRAAPNPQPQRAGFSGAQLESMRQKQLNRAGKMKQTQQQQQEA